MKPAGKTAQRPRSAPPVNPATPTTPNAKHPPAANRRGVRGRPLVRLLGGLLLWLLPVWAVWNVATPAYNRFLLGSAENLVQLTESPDVTDLHRHPDNRHDAYVERRDFPPAKALVHAFRVTDVHFHLVLLGALFLAVPGIPWKQKLGNLGVALLAAVFFHLFLLFFIVKAAYAAQLGPWSLEHYGPFARNFYGLGKHLLDLPFKLALPFALWLAFYLRLVTGDPGEE
jgi:hypothetical protein